MGEYLTRIGTVGGVLMHGKFVSDKYTVTREADLSDATADKLVLSFHDPAARPALQLFANVTRDEDLARDIKARLKSIEAERRDQPARRSLGDLPSPADPPSPAEAGFVEAGAGFAKAGGGGSER